MVTEEARESGQRGSVVAGWSVRRRWALAAFLLVGFLCCGLGAVPVVALLDHTDRQGDPPATAIAAVDTYLNQLLLRQQIGLSHALIGSEREDLIGQWKILVADMQRTDPPPSKLEWGRKVHHPRQADL
jgi:hypothetical protein